MSKEEYERLTAQGLNLETVGDILEGGHSEANAWQAPPILPPRLENQPAFPKPGIYFGMPEDDYHAIFAFSTSGIKTFSTSPADFWEGSTLNPEREADIQRDYFDFGKAIHCFVLEGEDTYVERYVIGLEKTSDVLETTEQIKAAIIEAGESPLSTIPTGQMKPSPTKAEPERMTPITRPAKKDDWINQLLALAPDALIWDRMQAEFFAEHEGAEIVTHKIDKRVRIAAKMILGQPDIAENFCDGYAEVSAFWHCPATGCAMKARFDYLKLARIVDLKSFSNKTGAPIDTAIERTIAAMRYNVQHVVYIEAIEAIKTIVRDCAEAAIFHCDRDVNADQVETDQRDTFVHALVEQPEPDFMFVFQKSNKAPVTRGKIMPCESMGVFGTTKRRVEELKRAFIACCEVYGTDRWLDVQPVSQIDDEAIPMWATEI